MRVSGHNQSDWLSNPTISAFRGEYVLDANHGREHLWLRAIILSFEMLSFRSYKSRRCIMGFTENLVRTSLDKKEGKQHVLGYQFGGQSSKGLPRGGEWRCFDIVDLSSVNTRQGQWYTVNSHTRPQTCVAQLDIEVAY